MRIVSNQAAPRPRTARPPDRWSSVVTILATMAGLRNVLAPTSSPMVGVVVSCDHAPRIVYASRNGPSGFPRIGYRWSQVHRLS